MPSASDPASSRRRLGAGAVVVIVILALTITVAIGMLRTAATPVEVVPLPSASADPVDRDGMYVHVSGAVLAPGLYLLDEGARVFDAIAAAGGFVAEADERSINLARPLEDGEQIVVAVVGDVAAEGAPGSVSGDGRINLNTADAAQLDTLPRVGESIAQRIIQWREQNGAFTSVEDLLAVPGIGDKMLESLRELVTV